MIEQNYIVIIPARGGSKSIKNKNLKKINDKSLIQISIEKFKVLDKVSNIIVTSDSDDILKEAKKYGGIPWKRPDNISGDNAISELALIDVLSNCEAIQVDQNIIFHQCTSPLLSTSSIKAALTQFEKINTSCLFTVQEEYNPIWITDEREVKILNNDDLYRKARQERKPLLIETGGLYIINRESFMKNMNRFGENPIPYKLSRIESIDIDDEIDLLITKKLSEI